MTKAIEAADHLTTIVETGKPSVTFYVADGLLIAVVEEAPPHTPPFMVDLEQLADDVRKRVP